MHPILHTEAIIEETVKLFMGGANSNYGKSQQEIQNLSSTWIFENYTDETIFVCLATLKFWTKLKVVGNSFDSPYSTSSSKLSEQSTTQSSDLTGWGII